MQTDDATASRPDPKAVKDLFALVLEGEESTSDDGSRISPVEVDAALRAAEPAVRSAVERLLAAHHRARGVLLEPSQHDDTASTSGTDTGQPSEPVSINGYEMGAEIGRGGFGVVYRARQLHPVERDVAVKILRTEFATREVIARFRAEARVLARMSHPGIARVLDAGLDTRARPFVTMELVDGQPLIDHAEAHGLSVRERVRLMIDVCDAVHHAHQRAVIHRDLKPANILVEQIDGRHHPRVIDFGIAKLLEEDGHDQQTRTGARLGTPRYMSPEQAAGTDLDDLRTDVYALGVLLCELLTGQVPRQPGQTDSASGSRHRTKATRPSQLVADTPSLAMRGRELRGDLDRIVLKAVALDLDERYDSAAAMAEDLHRYLDGRPVLATPPGMIYLTRKFIARRKITSAALVLAVISLVGGTAAAFYGLARANESRLQTEEALRETKIERDRSDMLAEFLLGNMLDALNPNLSGSSDGSITTLLRHVAIEANHRLADDRVLLHEALSRLGRAMLTLTDFEHAADTLGRAARIASSVHGPRDTRTLHARIDALLARMSARRLDGISTSIGRIVEDAEAEHPPTHPVVLRAHLHQAHIQHGTSPTAIARMREVVTTFETHGMTGTAEHLEALRYLARTMATEDHPEAAMMLRQAAEIAETRLGPTHSLVIDLRVAEARDAERRLAYDQAITGYEHVITTSVRQFGPGNWYHYQAISGLARIASVRSQHELAAELARERIAIAIQRDGAGSALHAASLDLAGTIAIAAGAYTDAIDLLQHSLEMHTQLSDEAQIEVLNCRTLLGEALVKLHRHTEAYDLASTVPPLLRPGHGVRTRAVIVLAEVALALEGVPAGRRIIEAELELLPEPIGTTNLTNWLDEHPG